MFQHHLGLQRPLSAAIALALGLAAMSAQPARAQSGAPAESTDDSAAKTDEAKTLEEVVVVSYRASIERALDIKRAEVGQTDTIVAEDIGKFPDLNLAESLQRIPGVAISRVAGEGRNVSVRGLGPQFTRIRLNGMEALATTGGTDAAGGNNRSRGFDFNVFASDLFNRITVRKTASADVEEGSLGATIDLGTPRPFDYGDLVMVGGAQAGYNQLSEEVNPRGSILLSNTWADGRFGALFSLAVSERQLLEEGASTVRWDNGTSSGGFNAASTFAPARLATTFHPRIPRYGVLTHDQDRLGATLALQFQPIDDLIVSLDGLYADLDASRQEDFLEAISFSRTGAGKPQTIVRDGFVDGRNNLAYGLFDDVDLRSESRYDEMQTRFEQVTLNGDWQVTDRFRLIGQIGHSRSEFDNPIQTTITLDRLNSDGYSWDFRNDDRLPGFDYGFDVTNPANWNFANGQSEIRLRPNTSDNLYVARTLDGVFDLNDSVKIKGGLNGRRYKFDTTELRRASEVAVPNLPAGTALSALTRIANFRGVLSAPSGTPSTWLIPDIDAFDDLFDIYSGTGTFALSPSAAGALGNNRAVIEDTLGGYLQVDFTTEVFGLPLRGNAGVRYVETDQSSTGIAVVNGRALSSTVDRSYDDTLPSMNLALDLRDDLVLRFGAAKTIARPALGNLTPGVTVSVSGGNRVVTGGDPFLEPNSAKTADLGLEWYIDDESLLAMALFYKDIDTFVQTTRETRPYSTSGLPDSLLAGTGASPGDDFQFNIPINTPGGPLKGVELTWQQGLQFLPAPFDNMGVILNYTYVDSEIQYRTAAGVNSLQTDLTGLSKTSYNATLYYEDERFSARVAAAYRDDYLTTVPGRNNNDVEGTNSTLNVDFMATWKYSDSLEFFLEGVNLTDEWDDQWVDSVGDRLSTYTRTGREYYVGFRWRN
jgi:TonB-dependent receptor